MSVEIKGIPGNEYVNVMLGGTPTRCKVIADRNWYDTISFAGATTAPQQFFVTLGTKRKDQALFEGDLSLVKEAEIALIYGMIVFAFDATGTVIPPTVDMIKILNQGAYEWKQDKITVSEDDLRSVTGGINTRQSGLAAGAAECVVGDGRHDNIRRFAKPIFVAGGRTIEFKISLNVARAAAWDLKTKFYGLHCVPVGPAA